MGAAAPVPSVPPPPMASVTPSVAVRVRELLRASVLPLAGEKPVTVAALPVVDPEEPVTLPVTLPVSGPENPVAVSRPAEGLNVSLEEEGLAGTFPLTDRKSTRLN